MKINAQNYVDEAEKVMQRLATMKNDRGRDIPKLTTSKIRNLLAMSADIYNEVKNQTEEIMSEELCSRVEYLRVRFLYEAGREEAVRYFVEESDILNILKGIQKSKKNYILFNHYMEALVAFHKFNGGRD